MEQLEFAKSTATEPHSSLRDEFTAAQFREMPRKQQSDLLERVQDVPPQGMQLSPRMLMIPQPDTDSPLFKSVMAAAKAMKDDPGDKKLAFEKNRPAVDQAVKQADENVKKLAIEGDEELKRRAPERQKAGTDIAEAQWAVQRAMNAIPPNEREEIGGKISKFESEDDAAAKKQILDDIAKSHPALAKAIDTVDKTGEKYDPVITADSELLKKVEKAAREQYYCHEILGEMTLMSGDVAGGQVIRKSATQNYAAIAMKVQEGRTIYAPTEAPAKPPEREADMWPKH